MHEQERRQALANFLQKRRAQLSPKEVGLPPGIRRRTAGLRREEVAQLANIGISWYVSLEQGRDVHPSASVLESISQALRLTLNERRHLFLLAGQSLPAHASIVEEQTSPVLHRLLSELNPIPAYVLGRRWDYLAWNHSAESVFTITQAVPPHSRNLIWRLFTNPTSKAPYPNWEQTAQSVLTEFHTASARYPGDAWFEELIDDLKQASSEFCQWWPHHDTPRTMDGYKVMEHLTLGHLEFEHITLQLPSDPDVRIVIYTPNTTTRVKMEQLQRVSDSSNSEQNLLI